MVGPPELRLAWHGTGPVRAHAWLRHPNGSTSDHISEVGATLRDALDAISERTGGAPPKRPKGRVRSAALRPTPIRAPRY